MAATDDKKDTRSSADEQSTPDEPDRDTFLDQIEAPFAAERRASDTFWNQLEARQRALEESPLFRAIQEFKTGADQDLEALRIHLASLLKRRPDIARDEEWKGHHGGEDHGREHRRLQA